MKVNTTSTPTALGATRRSGAAAPAGGADFSSHLAPTDSATAEARALESPFSIGGLEALLAIQDVGDSLEEKKKRKLIRHGEDLLDMLEELRGDLLVGKVSEERLIALARCLRNRSDPCSDPRLAGLIDEIELRAEVELAKLTRAAESPH